MNVFINAAPSANTTANIDAISEIGDPAELLNIDIIPDASQKPTWGDTCLFNILNSDGVTVDQVIGSIAVNPNAVTSFVIEEFYELTGGQTLQIIYTSVAVSIGAKVAINLSAVL